MDAKNQDYHDFVIKDGKFVGDFEGMYKAVDDPWEQSTRELMRTEKAIAIHLLAKYNRKKIVEVGCGKGDFTAKIHQNGFDVTGIDIAPTAISKARAKYPEIRFEVGDILDFGIYEKIKPDCIILAEISWYVLEKLERFLDFYKRLDNVYLVHLLNIYPKNVQKYGVDYFTTLDEIMRFFSLRYMEYGFAALDSDNGCQRTWFIAKN